jgi:glycosyltransferase involved in cell wall biosynthesis
MIESISSPEPPLVSLIICTFNRTAVLPDALRCAVRQTHRNLQILVINDGGKDVGAIVESFNDPRICLVQNPENHGKAACLNQALGLAKGKYVAYLDDDDILYPKHIQSLAQALEGPTDCQVAYSDLYRAQCRVLPNGQRVALGKYLEIIRDFDRDFLFHFNHVLHVSLMHRLDLIEKTGPYNESVKVLIDWDMTRRLAFYSDFLHVRRVTGEYAIPDTANDRISSRMRKDTNEYDRYVRTIRTTRPPKPWPKVKDLSIFFLPERMSMETAGSLGAIWKDTFVPYQIYVPLPQEQLREIQADEMPNMVLVPVPTGAPATARVEACLRRCEGECVALMPPGTQVKNLWVEMGRYALLHNSAPRAAYLMDGPPNPEIPPAVLWKEDLQAARLASPALNVRESLRRAGIQFLTPTLADCPFAFDEVMRTAEDVEAEGDWERAAKLYQKLPDKFANELWAKERRAMALHHTGADEEEAMRLCHEVNRERPSVESLLLEARLRREHGQLPEAIDLLESARQQLQWKGSP